jgi:hypothetical protein
MWKTLQHTEWVTALATSRWLFGLVLVVHLFTICFSVGSIVLLDLRILGLAARKQPLTPLAEQLRLSTWIGMGFAWLSGFLLFATEAGDYAAVTPFQLKVLVVISAMILSVAVDRNVANWDRAPVTPLKVKLLALFSIVLWLGAILVGVEIAPLTGLG